MNNFNIRAALNCFIAGDIQSVKLNKPVGVMLSDIFIQCVHMALATELDQIGLNFTLFRDESLDYVGIPIIESDHDFRNRLIAIAYSLDFYSYKIEWRQAEYGHDMEKNLKTTCVHNWTQYYGLSEIYDFCTLCSIKRD